MLSFVYTTSIRAATKANMSFDVCVYVCMCASVWHLKRSVGMYARDVSVRLCACDVCVCDFVAMSVCYVVSMGCMCDVVLSVCDLWAWDVSMGCVCVWCGVVGVWPVGIYICRTALGHCSVAVLWGSCGTSSGAAASSWWRNSKGTDLQNHAAQSKTNNLSFTS